MEKTKRATALLHAYRQIVKWCNENLQDCSYDVFVLQKCSGPFVWYDFVYAARFGELFFIRADHGSSGVFDHTFNTGMCYEDFDRCMSEGNIVKEYTKLRTDGNLVWDKELTHLINSWPSIKKQILSIRDEENEFLNFRA